MGLVSEPKEELEKKLNKIYSFDSSRIGVVEDFTEDILKDHKFHSKVESEVYNPDINKYGLQVYGEMTFKGVEGILRMFRNSFNKDTVFYDLGCGVGKMVYHIAARTDAKKCVGIELSEKRYNLSIELGKSITSENSSASIVRGDFFKQDYSDATIVYIDNTAYTLSFLHRVRDMLPDGCILIYKSYGESIGHRFFLTETTYLLPVMEQRKNLLNTRVWEFWRHHAFWTTIGGDKKWD